MKQPQHVNALIDAAQFGELGDRLLVVAQQELLGGAVRQGALGPMLQQGEFVVAHSPAARKVLPVFDGAVVWVQLQPQQVQQVFVVHEVADLGRGRRAAAFFTRAGENLQLFGTV